MALGQGGGTTAAGDAAHPSSISINIVDNEVVSAGLSNKK